MPRPAVADDDGDYDDNAHNDGDVMSAIDDGLLDDPLEHVPEEDGDVEEHDSESPLDEDVDLEGWDDADDGESDVDDDVVGADVDEGRDYTEGWDDSANEDEDETEEDHEDEEDHGEEEEIEDGDGEFGREDDGDDDEDYDNESDHAISSPAFYSCAPPFPPLPPRLPLGILASATTPAGSPLAAIPFPLWLSRLHGGWDFRTNRPAPPPPAPYKHAGDDVTVAAWLLREWRKGKESFYSPWINLLPGYVPLPIFWDEATLGELDSGEAIERVEEAIRYVEEAFSLCSDESIAGASMDEFKWAVAIVWSRSVPISAVGLKGRGEKGRRRGRGRRREGGGKAEEEGEDEEEFWQYVEEEAERGDDEGVREGKGEKGEGGEGEEVHMLLPLLDLFNHEFYYTADWQVRAGQPISVGYGSMDTAQFLLLYGFVPPNNPFDRFVLFENADALLDYYETKYLAATSGGSTGGEGTFSDEGEEEMEGGGGGEGGGAAAAGSDAGTVAGTDVNNESDYTEKYPWLTGTFDRDSAAASVTAAIAVVEARQADYTAEHDLDRQLLGMAAGVVAGSEALAIGREGYVDARLLAALAAIGMPTHDPAFDFHALARTILRFVFRDGVTCGTLKQQQTYHLAVLEAAGADGAAGGEGVEGGKEATGAGESSGKDRPHSKAVESAARSAMLAGSIIRAADVLRNILRATLRGFKSMFTEDYNLLKKTLVEDASCDMGDSGRGGNRGGSSRREEDVRGSEGTCGVPVLQLPEEKVQAIKFRLSAKQMLLRALSFLEDVCPEEGMYDADYATESDNIGDDNASSDSD
ncbi:unnamed protein product [Closterium sp. Naga37s-1]|nr:unnamed protein product [Closterium sp. Naga37s-1]